MCTTTALVVQKRNTKSGIDKFIKRHRRHYYPLLKEKATTKRLSIRRRRSPITINCGSIIELKQLINKNETNAVISESENWHVAFFTLFVLSLLCSCNVNV